jgi:predicted dinucleotide-binding enzyme
MTITRVGIIGAGALSAAFAKALARADVASTIGRTGWAGDQLSELLRDLHGAGSEGAAEMAAEEDVVFLSAPWPEVADTLAAVADWEARILIDATNRDSPGAGPVDRTSSEIVRSLSPGAQLVKAFNTLSPDFIAGEPVSGGTRVVFLAGDHSRAKVEVGRLASQMGFRSVDLGGLVSGGRLLQAPDGPLVGLDLVNAAKTDRRPGFRGV